MNQTIPDFVKPCLWSYDTAKLDLQTHKRRIITNVLNVGTKQATDWLFSTYPKEDIAGAVTKPLPGEWNKKSLNFWSLVLNVSPGNLERVIPLQPHD